MKIKHPAYNLQSIMSFLFYFGIAVGVVYYAYYQSQDLLAGSHITFESPKNGSVVNESLITVTGSAERISFIRLNGRQIFVDDRGVFEEKLPLLLGHNIMELHATDRFGRVTTERLYVTYEE